MERDIVDQPLQVPPAALVADPAGDADVQIHVERGSELVRGPGKAMRHGVHQPIAVA